MNNYIEYTIKATDSVKGIAKRFGVELDELVKLNPQVCTPKKQMGIVLKVPVDHLEVLPVAKPVAMEREGDLSEVITRYILKLPDKSVYKFDKIMSFEQKTVSQFATPNATQQNKYKI